MINTSKTEPQTPILDSGSWSLRRRWLFRSFYIHLGLIILIAVFMIAMAFMDRSNDSVKELSFFFASLLGSFTTQLIGYVFGSAWDDKNKMTFTR